MNLMLKRARKLRYFELVDSLESENEESIEAGVKMKKKKKIFSPDIFFVSTN